MSTTLSSTTVASIVGGEARTDAPGGKLTSTNPARLDDVVAEVLLGDAATFVDACRAARAAQKEWASVPAPARGRVIAQVGRLIEANKEALAALVTREIGKPYPGGARRGPGDRRHLRLLPRRGAAAVRADRAVGDARQAALHLPRAGRRGGDHHRGQLPGGRARLVPRAGDPVRQRRRLEARRVLRRARRRDGQALPRRRRARGRAQPRPGVGRGHLRGPGVRAGRGPGGQGRLHRLQRGRLEDRRAVRPPHPVAVPRARRQEPDGRDGRRRRRPRGRGRAVRRLRHRGPALHLARHGDRARVDLRRVRDQAVATGCRRRRSATRTPTCCTGR